MPRFLTIGVVPLLLSACFLGIAATARGQEASPPAYLAVVDGVATLERDGETEPAVRDMPFVQGDRLRTANGRVEIAFPDGTAIEVAENSEVEALSPTRVRLIAGTFDHVPRPAPSSGDSARYLPPDLQSYGRTLDENGSWGYSEPYGYVWYPTVAPDWRPYYNGSWSAVPSYGWTSVGADRWSWPTHHYGRWGNYRNAWFWIPGRTWSAAWVSWGSTGDYVSWCPLGYDNRPVFALSFGSGRAWNGWTVLSRSHFGGRGYYANRYAVDGRRFDSRTPFVQHARAPIALPHSRQANTYTQTDGYRRGPSSVDRRAPANDRRYGTDQPRATSPSPGAAVPRRAYPTDAAGAASRELAAPRRAYPIEAPGAASSTGPVRRYRVGESPSRTASPAAPAAPPSQVPGDANRGVPRYSTRPAPAAPYQVPGNENRAVPRYSTRPAAAASAPPPAAAPSPSAPPAYRYRPSEAGSRPGADRPAATRESRPAPREARPEASGSRPQTGTARERGGSSGGQPAHTRRPR